MLKIQPISARESEYPQAFECISNDPMKGLVVLFAKRSSGMVIKGVPSTPVGTYSSSWFPHTDTTTWKIANYTEPKAEKFEYPLAFKSLTDDVVVLFISLRSGLRIAPSLENEVCDHWLPHTDKKVWTPVDLTISHY